jgi:penicillin-binding protein 1A
MALGAGETTVLKLTAAYGMIANGGHKITPRVIDSIQDRYGNTLYQAEMSKERIIDSRVSQQMIHMLKGVVERGTAKKLLRLNMPLAGKTGTTNNYKDAWFVGFSPDLVVGVFVGFITPRSLGEGETGARVALPIFEQFMEQAYVHRPKLSFAHGVDAVTKARAGTTNLDLGANLPLSEEGLTEISLRDTNQTLIRNNTNESGSRVHSKTN